MATTTKKNTTKTNEEVLEATSVVEETPVVDATVKEVVKKPEPVITKKTFTDSDYVLCRSVCSGGLNIVSQSGNLYEFKDYGSECEINYRDLEYQKKYSQMV